MNVLGALSVAIAVAALVLAARATSRVGRRLDLIAPRAGATRARWATVPEMDLRHAGLAIDADRFLALKVASALAAALAAACVSLVLPLGPVVVLAAAFAGSVAPSLVVEGRARAERERAERATAVLVERLESLVAAGRPPESALAVLMRRPTGARLLDRVLGRAADAHMLGAPIFSTLGAHAREDGLTACAAIAEDLGRTRDLGTGSLAAIRERRAALRAAERGRALEAAAQVEGKLMLTLVLCYLPALVLLVVIPLFIGLLEGLFT